MSKPPYPRYETIDSLVVYYLAITVTGGIIFGIVMLVRRFL